MAHFAELGLRGIVQRVVVIHDNELLDENGQENEMLGIAFCQNLFGGTWIQTSYNGTIRKNFAGAGYQYDTVRDAFVAPKPFDSWVLNEDTCKWDAPVTYPADGLSYIWNETIQNWELA